MAQTKAKATAHKKTTKKRSATPKQTADSANFFEVRLTEQSLYWLIFGAASIAFALWLFSLDAKVRDLYDQVDANTNSMHYPAEHGRDDIQD
jgi:hypothetical protein